MNAPSGDKTEKQLSTAPRVWVWGRPWTPWRTARLLLLLLWAGTVLVSMFVRPLGLKLLVEILSSVVFVVLLWPWVRGPYLLYTRGWLSLHSRFEPTAQDPDDGSIWSEDSVQALGFQRVGVLSKSDRVRTEVKIFLHPGTGDSAQIARIFRRSGVLYALVSKSRFDDGFAFETSNSHTPHLFIPDPHFPVFRFPQLRSVADLYRIHQKLRERFTSTHVPCTPEASEELSHFITRAETAHQRIAKQGYKLDTAGARYAFTLKGAIRMAWLRTWPIDQIRMVRMEARAMKTAEQLGLPIHPKFGCLLESISSCRT